VIPKLKSSRPGIVIKVPQKIQVANYVLALSHHLSTGTTTALINGYCAMTMRKYQTGEMRVFLGDEHSEQSRHIRSQIQANPTLWTHPMFLPVVVLENHIHRVESFSIKLEDRVLELERSTGVVFAGRLGGRKHASVKQHTRRDIRKLTQDMHSTLSEIIIFSSAASWDVNCALALRKWCEEIVDLVPQDRWRFTIQGSMELAEVVEHLVSTSKDMSEYIVTLKERVQSQVTVVCVYHYPSLSQHIK
jgi:hypothetical protein